MFSRVCLGALALGHAASSASVSRSHDELPIRLETRSPLNSRAANIHVSLGHLAVVGDDMLSFTYGSCSGESLAEVGSSHHIITSRHAPSAATDDRLVWIIPENTISGGCLSAWSSQGTLLGRSAPQQLAPQRSRKRGVEEVRKRSLLRNKRDDGQDNSNPAIPMTNASGIDAWGPWFDGVELLQSKNLSAVDVGKAKAKKIGIVGAGMAGLMTFLSLRQAGFENLEIIEAGGRLGGRVHTEYLSGGPFDYSYQGAHCPV